MAGNTSDTVTRRIGMATSYPNTSEDMTYDSDVVCDEEEFVGDIPMDNRLIMNELNHQCLLMMFSLRGAVLGKDEDGFLFLKYWKRKNILNKCSQVIMRKPIIYLSGFCSRNRGLHWRI